MRLHSFISKIINEYNSEHSVKNQNQKTNKQTKKLAITGPQFKANYLFQVEQCIRIYLTEQTIMRQQIQFIFQHKHKMDGILFFFDYELKLNVYLACDGLVICPLHRLQWPYIGQVVWKMDGWLFGNMIPSNQSKNKFYMTESTWRFKLTPFLSLRSSR